MSSQRRPRVSYDGAITGGSASYQVQNDEELFREASWAGLNRPGRGVSVSSGGRSSQLSSGEGGLRVHFSSPLEMPPQLHKGPRHRVAEPQFSILKKPVRRGTGQAARQPTQQQAWMKPHGAASQSISSRQQHSAGKQSMAPEIRHTSALNDQQNPSAKTAARRRPQTPHRRSTATSRVPDAFVVEDQTTDRPYRDLDVSRDRPAVSASVGSVFWAADAPPKPSSFHPGKVNSREHRERSDVNSLDGSKARRNSTASASGTALPKRTPTLSDRRMSSIPWEKITAAYKPLQGGVSPGSLHVTSRPSQQHSAPQYRKGSTISGYEVNRIVTGVATLTPLQDAAQRVRALSAALR